VCVHPYKYIYIYLCISCAYVSAFMCAHEHLSVCLQTYVSSSSLASTSPPPPPPLITAHLPITYTDNLHTEGDHVIYTQMTYTKHPPPLLSPSNTAHLAHDLRDVRKPRVLQCRLAGNTTMGRIHQHLC